MNKRLDECIIELQGISKMLMLLVNEDGYTLSAPALDDALTAIGLHIGRIVDDLEQMARPATNPEQ